MKTSRLRRYSGYLTLVFCIVAAVWAVAYRQYIVDQLTVWQYKPTEAIESIASRADMSEKGKFFFYASEPSIDGTQAFNQYCKRSEPQSAILGCYAGMRIYIYQVDNVKLDGIEEVTAAHEMLHAAWDRLSDTEKNRVSHLLDADIKMIGDKDLTERMKYYARTEPGERENELHSILGTEYTNLSPELEKYYAQYFDDRSQLVALHEKYNAVFADIKKQGEDLSKQLTSLAEEINRRTETYNAKVSQLNKDVQNLNTRARAGDFTSQREYDNERAQLLARSATLDEERAAINTLIGQYRQIRSQLEAINSQAEALNRSIDSSLAPTPALSSKQ